MDITTFRTVIQEAGGYLRSMRGCRVAVHLPVAENDSEPWLEHLADLALLHHLGVRLAVVFAPASDGLSADNMDRAQLEAWMQKVTAAQSALMGGLNRALPGIRPDLALGNCIHARPLGVRDGHHSGYRGDVRSLDIEALNRLLDADFMVLLPPLAPSLLGEYYALDPLSLASRIALELPADKLIILASGLERLPDLEEGTLTAPELRRLAEDNDLPAALSSALKTAADTSSGGVERVHILDTAKTGVLIAELYTRSGAGALVASHHSERIRPAKDEDAAGLLRMIEPLEQQGVLVERGRGQLERELRDFLVLELEDRIIGCCALLQHGRDMELAALTVAQDYRRQGRADRLLQRAEREARQRGAKRLLVLTTVAEDWFLERGFCRGSLEDLPAQRAALYNYRRNSLVLLRDLADTLADTEDGPEKAR